MKIRESTKMDLSRLSLRSSIDENENLIVFQNICGSTRQYHCFQQDFYKLPKIVIALMKLQNVAYNTHNILIENFYKYERST